MRKISNTKTASSYALSWLNAAQEKHTEEKVFEEVQKLKVAIETDAVTWARLAAPDHENQTQQKVITDLAKTVKLSSISTAALKLIAENGRLNILLPITKAFIQFYYEAKGIIEVKVETATELSKEQDEKLKKVLKEKLNAEVLLDYIIKPEVLGGLAIRYKSFLIDDTLATKLKRLEQVLKNQQTPSYATNDEI